MLKAIVYSALIVRAPIGSRNAAQTKPFYGAAQDPFPLGERSTARQIALAMRMGRSPPSDPPPSAD